jgi:hypothetical protein
MDKFISLFMCEGIFIFWNGLTAFVNTNYKCQYMSTYGLLVEQMSSSECYLIQILSIVSYTVRVHLWVFSVAQSKKYLLQKACCLSSDTTKMKS